MNREAINKPKRVTATYKHHGRLRTYGEYAATWTMLKGFGALPRSVSLEVGRFAGSLAERLLPRLRRHADLNLRMAFPDMDATERARIRHGTFENLGRLLSEVSQFPRLTPENLASVAIHDPDDMEMFRRLQAEGRGIILLTGHIGAWELLAYAHSVLGQSISFLVRRVDNPLIENLVEKYRTRYGNRTLDKRDSGREVLRTLKSGGMVGLLADLNMTKEAGVFCDFFGISACTTSSVAVLAQHTGAAVLPVYIVWDAKARVHRLYGEKPIEPINTGNPKEDIVLNTARYTKVLEDIIRRYPDQWLWIHRRWRTRPDGEHGIY